MDEVIQFLADVNWLTVFFTIVLVGITIWLGIWLPGRFIERHTNQPVARYVWYVAGTLVMVMIYLAAYGYGMFWNIMAKDPSAVDGGRHSGVRQ